MKDSSTEPTGLPKIQAPVLPAAAQEGFVMVPVEPTREMLDAGMRDRKRNPTNINPYGVWEVMLAARPQGVE